ncbi:opacity protein-like surface antigen [Kluyvera sp. 1366]
MKMENMFYTAPLFLIANMATAAEPDEGYYGAARYLLTQQRAQEMNTSARPGVGQFVTGKEKATNSSAALAYGYQWGNGWRTEGEYTFGQSSEFTSGSSTFATSYNHLQTNVHRLMINAYRDVELGYNFSLYGTAGIGLSRIKAGGWQGVPGRQYADSTQINPNWSVGAGVSYKPFEKLNIDLGYRYVDMGKVESGYNNFVNARLLKDEQMKAHLVENQLMLGMRYLF